MPRRADIRSILLIGAGPIVIGQACEFDYSGVQACKALRAEGYRVILVNSNPATIMTDPDMADVIYVEPVEWETVARIIERERPDAILPTMGGQTALNCALDLAHHGVLAKFGVELIGARVESIEKAENRELFKQAMEKIGLAMPRAVFCNTIAEVMAATEVVGYPAVVRPSFTLGGTGGGIGRTAAELYEIATRGLEASPVTQVLIEESVIGWKEFEMEVVRDRADNCIIICSIENFDAMGVHTGDSITVAPALTLTDKEYQVMRDASFAVMREIGVDTGGSNVQFAVSPKDGRLVVIEMNPRVSRSSALASKATGFPIAKIAAKLAVGYTLDELDNDITRVTPASFEPTLDYVVVKCPRFAFEKFRGVEARLTTQMKSVGEVMAIGRTFLEALGKALRSLELGHAGLEPKSDAIEMDDAALAFELERPGPERILYMGDALRRGWKVDKVARLSGVDPWFVDQLLVLVEAEAALAKLRVTESAEQARPLQGHEAEAALAKLCVTESAEQARPLQGHEAEAALAKLRVTESAEQARPLQGHEAEAALAKLRVTGSAEQARPLQRLERAHLRNLKRQGFSDRRIAKLIGVSEAAVRARRHELGLRPVYFRVDTCAAEFASETPYLYSTYEDRCEARPTDRKKVLILGAGPNRIGQGIEFDYCCVHAALALRADGFETIMVNCNPETVSTDYDTSDRLYFEPVTLEDVLEIVHVEKPFGVIVQLGGQTPLKLVRGLEAAGVPILGTSPDAIDLAEDRERFQALLRRLGLKQPENATAMTRAEAQEKALTVGFPLVVRPSYVLGGRAMEIAHSAEELERYLDDAFAASEEQPVLFDRYLRDAIEIDVDALSDGDEVVIGGVMEHIEQAGIHSGDSACSLPPYSISAALQAELRRQTVVMAKALGVVGLMNVQFAVYDERPGHAAEVYVLEVNPRASRTVPFVAKATGRPLAKLAARIMAGKTLAELGVTAEKLPSMVSVKEAVLPFRKFPGVDVMLGPEMKSTGETMGSGTTFPEAYAKALLGAGVRLPLGGRAVLRVDPADAAGLVPVAEDLRQLGFEVVAGQITAQALEAQGQAVEVVDPAERLDGTTLVLAAGRGAMRLRKAAYAARITTYTTIAGLSAGVRAIARMKESPLPPRTLAEVQG